MPLNLSAYDSVKNKVDYSKTWVIVSSHTLSSHEIKYRPYSCLLQRYNPNTKTYVYYICMSNVRDNNHYWTHVYNNPGGRIRISLKEIWNKSSLNLVKQDTNIAIILVEQDDIHEIYRIIDA